MPSDEWIAGYRAGLVHVWAHPLRKGGLRATASDREVDAPEGSSADFIDGWRLGTRARH